MSSSNPAPLSPFVRGVTDKNVYFLQGALRRLVPDAATLSFIAAGQPVRTLSDAALAAIKLGSPLPSRADGTLLSGKSQIAPPVKIVYFMSRGQRRRIPDVGTLTVLVTGKSAVHDVDPADLSAIREGPALPTRREGALYRKR